MKEELLIENQTNLNLKNLKSGNIEMRSNGSIGCFGHSERTI
jgi:hypothetical protein